MLTSLFRADAAGDRSAYGDFWFGSVGGRSASGMRITPDTALRLSSVYACVRVLTESFAVLPFKLYRRKAATRGRQLVLDHWAHALFTRRPNRFQTSFEFKEMLQGHLALRGNAFCEIVEDGRGGIAELLPRHPDCMRIEPLANESWRYVVGGRDGSQRILRRDQVWHLRGLSSDGIVGLSPLDLARESVGAGLAAQDYGNRFFANDAKPSGGWIEFPGKIADKTARENLTESIKSAISGANRHRLLTLDQGMKYHEVGMTNKDSQFLESRGYTRTEIAGVFRVPPHMIGDLSRATFSNIEQQAIDFWQNCMLPWCERWESSLELLIDDETLEVEFDFRSLMRGDSDSRGKYLHAMVLDGVLTRNEARAMEGHDPLEGLDEPLVPMNERLLSEPSSTDAVAPKTKPDSPAMDGVEDEADARLLALASATAGRVARKEVAEIQMALRGADPVAAVAKFWTKHAVFVAAAMGVSDAVARTYCAARMNEVVAGTLLEEAELTARCRLERLALKGTP